MAKNLVIIDAVRDAYSISDVRTMTVGELIDTLQEFDEDALVVLSHDNGYTYGGLSRMRIEENFDESEEY